MAIQIESIAISDEKGTIKHPVNKATVYEHGIQGDAHAGLWHRQVSLLDQQRIENFEKKVNRKIEPGEFAENLILSGKDFSQVAILDRFKIGNVLLEITQIGKTCHDTNCTIYQSTCHQRF